ncbi:MAG: ArsR family transcriptional regulator [Planctomycetota bacterium]|nr:MAG: ArsR family transcriptional regulator [Planctomycetota bacterium]
MTGDSQAGFCARLLRVLADHTRLRVVRMLLDGERRAGEIGRRLGIEKTLLSHHLRVLREAGVVVGRRVGKSVVYSLAPAMRTTAQRAAIDLGCCRLQFDQDGTPAGTSAAKREGTAQ